MAWSHQCWQSFISAYGVTRGRWVNSLKSGNACMCQRTKSSLVDVIFLTVQHQAISWTKCWRTVNWSLRNKTGRNFHQNTKIPFEENVFENVISKMATILSWPQCVTIKDSDPYESTHDMIMRCLTVNDHLSKIMVYIWWNKIKSHGENRLESDFVKANPCQSEVP